MALVISDGARAAGAKLAAAGSSAKPDRVAKPAGKKQSSGAGAAKAASSAATSQAARGASSSSSAGASRPTSKQSAASMAKAGRTAIQLGAAGVRVAGKATPATAGSPVAATTTARKSSPSDGAKPETKTMTSKAAQAAKAARSAAALQAKIVALGTGGIAGLASEHAKAATKTPKTAGGAHNARTNATPKGTKASDLDAALPKADHAQAIKRQEQARTDARAQGQEARKFGDDSTAIERQSLARYYAEQPTYVDPETRRVYHASYDVKTGNLTLVRNDDQAGPGDLPKLPEPSVAPTSTKDDSYHEADKKPRKKDADAPKDSPQEAPKGLSKLGGLLKAILTPSKPQSSTSNDAAHDEHDHAHEHDAGHAHEQDSIAPAGTGFIEAAIASSAFSKLGGYVRDEEIVISPGGTRTETSRYAQAKAPTSGGMDQAFEKIEVRDRNGKVTSTTSSSERTSIVAGGDVVERTSSSVEGS
ncbi:MAG: hypothetical protein ABI200_07690 [Gaiellales bacterium]